MSGRTAGATAPADQTADAHGSAGHASSGTAEPASTATRPASISRPAGARTAGPAGTTAPAGQTADAHGSAGHASSGAGPKPTATGPVSESRSAAARTAGPAGPAGDTAPAGPGARAHVSAGDAPSGAESESEPVSTAAGRLPVPPPAAARTAGAAGRTAPSGGGRLRAWAELLRVSALFTVPGDALAGAACAGVRPNRRTVLAIGSSLCLYEAGMALNDWADRDEDAVDRPHRPIPSGRISPAAALSAAGALTAAGLALAARAGRAPLAVATALAAAVWAYDVRLKHTPAGPAAMASARTLDLLLGAMATQPRAFRSALPHAALLGAHTYAVTSVSRHETQGGSTKAPLAALATTLAIAAITARDATAHRSPWRATDLATTPARPGQHTRPAARGPVRALSLPPMHPAPRGTGGAHSAHPAGPAVAALTTALYVRTTLTPLLHAALNPSPPLTQRAVGAGIRAMIPLQAALAARAGASGTGLAVLGLIPVARRLARKVSPT
ncbi:SCO3242 family prenyltransferase [Streptomyces sp. NPDC055709]